MHNSQQSAPETGGQLMEVPEAHAAYFGGEKAKLSMQSLYRRCKDGTFPAIQVGRRWFILREPFERMLRGELDEGK